MKPHAIFFLLLFAEALSAQVFYPASGIPQALLKHADIVVRQYELRFEALHKGEAMETEHKVFTVLNEAGAKRSELYFPYSKFVKIEDIEAAVYDSEGKLVRHLKKKDIEDVKPPEQYVNDSRYKVLRLPARSFPYTIEYTVVTKNEGLMFYPVFHPQERPSEAVEQALFEVKMPAGLAVRFKETNLPPNCKTGPMRWEFKNIQAFQPEPFAPATASDMPEICSAPTEFVFGGFSGNMHTWQSFGVFLQQLNGTQQELSPETRAALREMVADCPDAPCKIRRIYDHLQANTRYFYVGLGIGGWQPALASQVDQLKYGDCKGLSNYMVAMLKAVDVPAYYAIVRAGEDQQLQFPDFPNAHFNHVIACSPVGKDTIWLECTSQTESCGFLGTFTDNRPALLVTPEGGKLVRTPHYDETHNTTHRETDVVLAPDGRATLHSKGIFKGISQEVPAALAGYSEEIQKKYFYETLNVSDFEIQALEFKRNKAQLPSVEQTLRLDIPKLASVSGKRLFVPLSLLSTKMEVPPADSARRSDVQADARGFTETDALTIALPEGFRLESPFDPLAVTTAFGRFELSVQQEPGKILIHRKLVLNNKVQPKAQFGDWVAFLKTIVKADKSKLVLVKQT